MAQFVTLKTYFTPHEAHLDKNFLETAGIECYILNELSTQVYNFHTQSDGGVVLKVKQSDLESAVKLLNEDNMDLELDESFEVGVEDADKLVEEVSFSQGKSSTNTWLLLLIGLTLLIILAALAGGLIF